MWLPSPFIDSAQYRHRDFVTPGFDCGCLAGPGAALLANTIHIFSEDCGFVAGRVGGDEAEGKAEQIGMDAGVGTACDLVKMAFGGVRHDNRQMTAPASQMKSSCSIPANCHIYPYPDGRRREVRCPCESGFAGCRRQGFADSRRVKGTRIVKLSEYLRAR